MQQIQYFKSAWGDIKNSPGWFGKLCLLALINFIPIFGQIVTFGYLYGWAREIAWGAHEPMPARIFSNEDGKFYRRGWFILVLMFVASLVPSIVMGIGSSMQGAGLWGVASNSHNIVSSLLSGVGLLVYLIGVIGVFLLSILAWIGAMRISIYDRLSAGFQVGKIWKMFRQDTSGVMRIFGMYLLVGIILGIILSILYFIVVFFIIFTGVAGLAANGYNVNAMQHMTDAQAMAMLMQFIASAGVVGTIGILILVFVTYVASTFVLLLVARAMGYWTRQFDVPHWCGQDDPMPFETAPPAMGAPLVTPVPPAAQSPYDGYGQPAQPTQPVQQPAPVAPVAPAAESSYWDEDAYAEPAAGDSADDSDVDARVDEPAVEGEGEVQPVDSVRPADPAPTVAPGELAGFTYTGTPAVSGPVTPSGADPAAEAVPDLLVVVPEAPVNETPADTAPTGEASVDETPADEQ